MGSYNPTLMEVTHFSEGGCWGFSDPSPYIPTQRGEDSPQEMENRRLQLPDLRRSQDLRQTLKITQNLGKFSTTDSNLKVDQWWWKRASTAVGTTATSIMG